MLKHAYSDAISNCKVAVLGPYPPPIGGVSVHVKRVIEKFEKQKNIVKLFNTCVEYRYRFFAMYIIKLFWFLILFRSSHIFLHTVYLSNGLWELRFIILLKKMMHFQLTLVEHDCRYLYTKSASWKKKFNASLRHVDQLICIGNSTYQSYIDNKIMLPKSAQIEAAFLPPNTGDEVDYLSTYPASIHTFISQHRIVLLANAFQLSLLNGNDLYGFNLCVQALAELAPDYKDVGLILVLAQIGNPVYFDHLQKLIKSYHLENHIYFLSGQKELWPLFKKTTIFVRPTLSDGESVSIQEALYFGVPVIASDAVLRPNEVIIFKSGDVHDLYKKLKKMLEDLHYEAINKQRDYLHAQSPN